MHIHRLFICENYYDFKTKAQWKKGENTEKKMVIQVQFPQVKMWNEEWAKDK